MSSLLILLITGLLVYGLLSKRLADTPVTGPLLFTALGFLVGEGLFKWVGVTNGEHLIHTLAEVTLVLVLFMDAARIDFRKLAAAPVLPLRMLLFGLPLVVAGGVVAGIPLFSGLGIWELVLLAAILAPTDAALGQAVVTSDAVPAKVRQALNVESGLNDGIALPLVLIAASLASMDQGQADGAFWLGFTAKQVILGPIAGVVVAVIGAVLVDRASQRGWMGTSYEGIIALSVAGLCYLAAEAIGGNGFIAAFIGGMVFGNRLTHECEYLYEFGESEGQLLVLTTFFFFGLALLPEAIDHATPAIVFYALLSLLVVRPLAIGLSLLGTGVRPVTMAFFGWFGPRGLASVLFILLVLDQTKLVSSGVISTTVLVTVALSIMLHGLTAAPLSRWYGQKAADAGDCVENEPVEHIGWRMKPVNSRTSPE